MKPNLSLRNVLTIPYLVLTLVPAAVILLLSYFAGSDAVEKVAAKLLDNVALRASQAVDRHLVGSHVALEAVFPLSDGAHSVAIPSIEELEKRLSVATALHREPNNYIYYGNRQGQFIGVNRQDKDSVQVRIKTDPQQARRFYRVTNSGAQRVLEVTETEIYDPRTRPWYKAVLEKKQPIWTPFYVDFRTGELVTTRAHPVIDANGELEGVIATDVSIRQLSEFISTLKASPNGVIFVVENTGDLMGTSSAEALSTGEGRNKKRVNAAASIDKFVREAYATYRDDIARNALPTAPLAKQFTLNGETIFSAMHIIKVDAGINWFTVVAVPRADLMGEVNANLIRSGIIAFIASMIALTIGLWVVNWVARDLNLLNRATQRLRGGHLFEPIGITRRDEIGDLARNFEKMHVDLQTDELTRAYNRETLTRIIDRRIQELRKNPAGTGFAIMFIDLNFFKQINDEHGHLVGDRVLMLAAARLKQTLRAGDLVARYGGDEFLVLLQGVGDMPTAKTVADKAILGVAEPSPDVTDRFGEPIVIRMAVGLALYPGDGESTEQLIAVADARMYDHKEKSRAWPEEEEG